MQRMTKVLLAATVLALAWSALALAAASPKYQMADLSRAKDMLRLAGDPEKETISQSESQNFGRPVFVGAAPAGSPGLRIGETWYDYQHNGSTGRQIDVKGAQLQATWMKGTLASLGLGRNVYWNKAAVTGPITNSTLDNGKTVRILPLGGLGSVDGNEAVTGGTRPGYTTYRNLATGRGVGFMHDAPETGGGAVWHISIDNAIAAGVFTKVAGTQPPGIAPGDEVIWPKGATDVVGTDTILHVVGRGSSDAVGDPIYYWRGTRTGAVAVSWAAPQFIDSATTISYVVEQDPTSDKVAIVYSKPRTASQVNNDIAYRLSTNGGVSFGPIVNVTNYTDSSLDRAYTDLDAAYDLNGTLHIIYNTFDFRPGEGTFFEPVDLWHWNSLRGTSRVINTVDLPDGGNSCSEVSPFNGGAWNLVMAKPSISVKPAGAHGIAEELIYAIWVQFGPTTTDCASQDSAGTTGGEVNGEIWCSVSADDGLTWDRPVNLTGTSTPNCTPGNCNSEHWVTSASWADSGVYLSFVNDTHAGGIPQGEGVWSISPYKVYAVEARQPVLEPRISVGPTTFQELNVAPGGSKTVKVFVNNVGNATLNFTATVTNDGGGATHVLVNGLGVFPGSIPAAGAPVELSIAYDGIGLANPSEHDWRIEVTSNDSTNNPAQGGTAISIKLNVFVADPWFTCTKDTISTGQHRLAVGSCLELADQNAGGGLYSYANQSEWVFDASPVIARLDGATKRAYRDIFWNSLADRSRDSNRAFRAQSAITVVRGASSDVASGVAYTTDSLIKLAWEASTYKQPDAARGMVTKYTVTNRTGTTFSGLALGAAADLDVDSAASANTGIAEEASGYVGVRGGYRDGTGNFIPINNYAALFHIPLDATCTSPGVGGQVLTNPAYVFPEGAYNSDSLYNWMTRMVGWSGAAFPVDTPQDLNVVLVSRKGASLGPNDTLRFAFGMALSDVSISDLKSMIAVLRNKLNSACIAGCPITKTGDVNNNGVITSADIIYLVNFVFKGGPAPAPCAAAGDVNCNGAVTSADIIFLVNFVFKGGPAPCDACTSPLAAAC